MKMRRAYTYIELVLTASILAILAAIAVPNFLEAQIRALVSRSKSELSVIKMGIEAYRLDHRAYPPNAVTGESRPGDLAVITTPIGYIPALPYDAFTAVRDTRRAQMNMIPEPYRYVNGFQVRPGEGLRYENPSYENSGAIAGLIWGYGPARDSEDEGSTSEAFVVLDDDDPSTSAMVRLDRYDPSNGTISHGNIYTRLP